MGVMVGMDAVYRYMSDEKRDHIVWMCPKTHGVRSTIWWGNMHSFASAPELTYAFMSSLDWLHTIADGDAQMLMLELAAKRALEGGSS